MILRGWEYYPYEKTRIDELGDDLDGVGRQRETIEEVEPSEQSPGLMRNE
jgi:hypothetical protein